MKTGAEFRIDAEGRCVMARLILGFIGTALAYSGILLGTGVVLILSVWMDAATGWFFRKRSEKSISVAALETYADVGCFVVTPIIFTAELALGVWPKRMLFVFALAAVYRLARFQVQGIANGGYLGLPVTYNGYLFPLAGLAVHFWPASTDIILVGLLGIVSLLMVSKRFVIPEF